MCGMELVKDESGRDIDAANGERNPEKVEGW